MGRPHIIQFNSTWILLLARLNRLDKQLRTARHKNTHAFEGTLQSHSSFRVPGTFKCSVVLTFSSATLSPIYGKITKQSLGFPKITFFLYLFWFSTAGVQGSTLAVDLVGVKTQRCGHKRRWRRQNDSGFETHIRTVVNGGDWSSGEGYVVVQTSEAARRKRWSRVKTLSIDLLLFIYLVIYLSLIINCSLFLSFLKRKYES